MKYSPISYVCCWVCWGREWARVGVRVCATAYTCESKYACRVFIYVQKRVRDWVCLGADYVFLYALIFAGSFFFCFLYSQRFLISSYNILSPQTNITEVIILRLLGKSCVKLFLHKILSYVSLYISLFLKLQHRQHSSPNIPPLCVCVQLYWCMYVFLCVCSYVFVCVIKFISGILFLIRSLCVLIYLKLLILA